MLNMWQRVQKSFKSVFWLIINGKKKIFVLPSMGSFKRINTFKDSTHLKRTPIKLHNVEKGTN